MLSTTRGSGLIAERIGTVSFGDVPTYVYKFVDTGETIEVQQSFDEPTLTETTHPVTGATMAVKKVFQPVGVTFRGSGFYKTDSRSGSKSSGSSSSGSSTSDSTKSSDSSSPSPSSSSTTTSSETKTASTTPTSSD